MTPDIQFLINCCKTRPTASEIEQIRTHITQLDHQQLSEMSTLAHAHGIFPLVYHAIQTHAADRLTKDTMAELKQQNLTIVMQNMQMTAELIRIMRLLEENGIDALAFKGPALAQMAYGDITLRQYVDLDILTRKEDIYRIDAQLKALGYERLLALTSVQEKIWINYAHDIVYVHPKSNVILEMHWSLLDDDYPLQFNLNNIWKHPNTVTISGQNIKAFPTDDLLLYLCIHGSKHLWERIEWVKDIDLLIQNEAIDWEKLIVKAEDSGFKTMFFLGLSLTKQLFETPVPDNITRHISDIIVLDKLSDFVLQSWPSPKSTIQKTAAKLKLFPSMKHQALYLHKVILKPSFNEYWYVDLPQGFYWGYYLVRPYLLIKKYISKRDVNIQKPTV